MIETITIRVDEETKRKIKRYGIPAGQVARIAILREIQRKEGEEAPRAVRRMKQILKKIDVDRIAKEIREDRAAR
jgi:NADH:ubiquinone oxidoreductase subunit E